MTAPGLGSRSDALERLGASLREPLDLLVVGGGITGAGIALDAASRGLRVGLVERFDFASGTSSKSSKLVHGGVRYLEQREFSLVREASAERDLLCRLAPHLVEPIPFVLPVAGRSKRALYGAGLWAYDMLGGLRHGRPHRYVDRDEVENLIPSLPRGRTRGGYVYYDSRTDDVRLVIEVLAGAVRHGAVVANYAAVRDLEPSGAVPSALVEDTLTGELFEVRARRIVVAAGVWADRVEALASQGTPPRLRPSKGVHLAFAQTAVPMSTAAGFIPDAAGKRLIFLIPWTDAVIVGTTDVGYTGDPDRPTVSAEERAYFLDSLNAALDVDLGESDIVGAWAGLRPLVAGAAGATADLSRRHTVYDIAPGVVGITGGKLTTFRRMAEDVVDRVAAELGHSGATRTRWLRLGCSDLGALRAAVDRRASRAGIRPEAAANLVRCYGERALAVLDVAWQQEAVECACPGTLPLIAEVLYCVRFEMVRQLSDFLARRSRLALTDAGAGIEPGSRVADVLGAELGWSSEETARQVGSYRIEVEAERGLPLATASPAAV